RRLVLRGAVAEELDGPRPRHRPEGELEHARPVDAVQRRIGVQPVLEVADETIAIAAIAGQPAGGAEQAEVLMAVGLPDDLVIAVRRIEVAHFRPEAGRRATMVHRIRVPVGWIPDRDVPKAAPA